MKVKVLVAQSCLALCESMDCSLPGFSVHGGSLGKKTGVGCHALLQGIFLTQGSTPGLLTADGFFTTSDTWEPTSLVAQTVKHLPAMRETHVQSLGREDPLEEEMATHSSILAWKTLMDREVWQATVHGVANSRT